MVAAWGGQLSYGVFVHDGVPFVVVFFRQGGLSLNPGINILYEVEAGRSAYKEFLDADSKAVALTLVDSVSNSVRATRTISFSEPALSILRQVCRKQLDAGTALDIRASIWETTETCESSTMLLLSQAHGNLPAEQQNCRNC